MSTVYTNKLRLEVLEVLQEYVRKHPPYSDFNVLNLFMWNIDDTTEVGFYNNNLILKIKDYFSDKQILTFLGTNKVENTIETLLTVVKQYPKDYLQELKLIPDTVIQNIDKSITKNWSIVEDPDNHDYILSTDKLVALKGNEMKSVRRTIEKFKKLYPKHLVKILDLDTDTDQIVGITKAWETRKGITSGEDISALENLLKYHKHFETLSLGVFIEDNLVGYTINELVQGKTAIGHFGKTDISYAGSSNYLEYVTAKELKDRGYEFINHEQDTGILSLRQTKLSYRPVTLLKKWKIIPNTVK